MDLCISKPLYIYFAAAFAFSDLRSSQRPFGTCWMPDQCWLRHNKYLVRARYRSGARELTEYIQCCLDTELIIGGGGGGVA